MVFWFILTFKKWMMKTYKMYLKIPISIKGVQLFFHVYNNFLLKCLQRLTSWISIFADGLHHRNTPKLNKNLAI